MNFDSDGRPQFDLKIVCDACEGHYAGGRRPRTWPDMAALRAHAEEAHGGLVIA